MGSVKKAAMRRVPSLITKLLSNLCIILRSPLVTPSYTPSISPANLIHADVLRPSSVLARTWSCNFLSCTSSPFQTLNISIPVKKRCPSLHLSSRYTQNQNRKYKNRSKRSYHIQKNGYMYRRRTIHASKFSIFSLQQQKPHFWS